ncbi:MAG TPA: hypothetical protein VK943_09925 [Arenibaculum sp.]|nr:hypothetical protein [Arenibaculum sp.]
MPIPERRKGRNRIGDAAPARSAADRHSRPTRQQVKWLSRGVGQPGGKLPLFDEDGQRVPSRIVAACIRAGWAEPWFDNPLKPDWQVCRLTAAGRAVAANAPPPSQGDSAGLT